MLGWVNVVYSDRKMALVAIGGRIPEVDAIQLKQIQDETGKSQSEVVREAVALYLGHNPPESVTQLNKRVSSLEKQLTKLQRLVLTE